MLLRALEQPTARTLYLTSAGLFGCEVDPAGGPTWPHVIDELALRSALKQMKAIERHFEVAALLLSELR